MSAQNFLTKSINKSYGTFVLHLDPDAMSVYISCRAVDASLSIEQVLEVIGEAEIQHGVQEESISEMLAYLREKGETPEKTLVALGTEPTEGKDGRLDFEKRPVGGQFKSDDSKKDERVDYRETSRFDNIAEGDHVATLVPAVPGQGGSDIYGRVIPAAKVEDVVCHPGENVRFDEAERKFYATHHGCMYHEQKTLRISDLYTIQGNVDLAQGNIDFIGRVEITGDVKDDFKVTAQEGIMIGGTAEACVLRSPKEIRIAGGVTGKGKGRIECGGVLVARFLNDVDVICNGDVNITKEIINARVYSLGRVLIQTGSIMSSEVVGLRGILCQDVGSELGVRTILVAGIHYRVYKQLRELDQELVKLEDDQQRKLNTLGKWFTEAEVGEQISSLRRESIHKTMREVRANARRIKQMTKKTGDLTEEFKDQALPCVCVGRNLNESVTVVTAKYERDTQQQIKGPLSIMPDYDRRMSVIESGLLLEKLWEDRNASIECFLHENKKGKASEPGESDSSGSSEAGDAESEDAKQAKIRAAAQRDWDLEEIEEKYLAFDPEAASVGEGTVLVAEDQANMRMLIAKALEKKGFKVLQAPDGLEAIKALKTEPVDGMVLDIGMPKVNGIEILKAMKRDPRFEEIPVVVCSARKTKQDIMGVLMNGAAAYIVKPFQMEELIKKVTDVIAEKKKGAGAE